LCREGRVEARLVGRSWYVREAAIKDHRFGAENEPKKDESIKVVGDTVEDTESPRYEIEVPKEIPLIKEDTIKESESDQNEENIADRMQKAWQDWFSANNQQNEISVDIEEKPLYRDEPKAEEYIESETEIKISKIEYKPNNISDIQDYRDLEADRGDDLTYKDELSMPSRTSVEPKIVKKSYRGLKIALILVAALSIGMVAINFVITTTSTSSEGLSWVESLSQGFFGNKK
jgi:hypothetical protein